MSHSRVISQLMASAAASENKWDGDGVPLEESNCFGIGSAEDKAVRKAAAQTEPAWQGAGSEHGILIWRIENFKIVPVPKESLGIFYTGDSYIILHTDRKEDKFVHHIYFWLGEKTSIDEMGTAAYKTVELDDFLDGEPSQSREVMGAESQQFKSLLKGHCNVVRYLDGGVASSFHHTAADTYQAKLLQVRKTAHGIVSKEVTCSRESLNEGDVFVLDAGKTIYQWVGAQASPFEKHAANKLAEHIESTRCGRATASHEIDDKFWELLGGDGPIKSAAEGSDKIPEPEIGEGILYEVESKDLKMKEVGRGKFSRSLLNTDAVMILDHIGEVCIWVGRAAPQVEVHNAFRTVMRYLQVNGRSKNTPVHMYKEGVAPKNPVWNNAFTN